MLSLTLQEVSANFFAYETAAQRYAANRPYFHPLVIERIRNYLNLTVPLDAALDVACGTGQSSLALKAIARQVTATDISPEMMAQAVREEGINYVVCPAEDLPFGAEQYDLITVSLAFHWLDRERFLSEAARVLKNDGWLVIYNNGFSGQMRENEAFSLWNQEYLLRYPTPPRNYGGFTPEDATLGGFHFANAENFTNEVPFSVEQLTGYLLTQSNVIAAVEQGSDTIEDVQSWISQSLQSLFPTLVCHFHFSGYIWFLQKENRSSCTRASL